MKLLITLSSYLQRFLGQGVGVGIGVGLGVGVIDGIGVAVGDAVGVGVIIGVALGVAAIATDGILFDDKLAGFEIARKIPKRIRTAEKNSTVGFISFKEFKKSFIVGYYCLIDRLSTGQITPFQHRF